MLKMKLRGGYGYWDVTQYPIGGKFCRAPADGLAVTVTDEEPMRYNGARYIAGYDDAGHRVAFQRDHAETIGA